SSMKQSWGPGLLILEALILSRGINVQTLSLACGQRGPGPPTPREAYARPGEWPWQASVRRQGVHICSGSLVSDTWVLTAAHCFDRTSVTDLRPWSVVLGSLQQDGIGLGAEEVGLTSLHLPQTYSHYTKGSDMALLQLNHSLHRSPICLPQPSHRFPFGASCWATGWGQGTARAPGILRNLRLRLISRPTCNCLYNRLHLRQLSSPARHGMLCAGAPPGAQGPCQGDSGGPVLCQEPDGHWVQVGIISFSSSCAQEDTPVLLTDLAAYTPWLRTQALGAVFLYQSPEILESSDEDSCIPCGSLKGKDPHPGAPSPWPWDVHLRHLGQFVCGGALVSEEVVLTAAHCFIGRQTLEEWTIGLGKGEVERGLRQLTLHGAYTHPEGGYDIALLLLSQPVILGPSLRPLCLPYASHHLPEGAQGWALGRAQKGTDLDPSLAVPVTLLGPGACSRLHAAPGGEGIPILPGMLCGSAVGELLQCEGLSGSPLVHEVMGTWFLAGLHSFSDACRGPVRPGVFTALPAYEDWVSSIKWQVYFAEPPESEIENCPANPSMKPSKPSLLYLTGPSLHKP
uniref:Serine protease 53 n=1 Tax=Monodelphis domestica TaxID=13616 RepID=F6T5U1_MONDO